MDFVVFFIHSFVQDSYNQQIKFLPCVVKGIKRTKKKKKEREWQNITNSAKALFCQLKKKNVLLKVKHLRVRSLPIRSSLSDSSG